MKNINKWRASFIIVFPLTVILTMWLAVTLPLDQPQLFLRLLCTSSVMMFMTLYIGMKTIKKGC